MTWIDYGWIVAVVYLTSHLVVSLRDRMRLEDRVDELEELLQERAEQRRRRRARIPARR